MRIHAGGDPRALPDYQKLCQEMAKLSHPACPDVDWQFIERCCLALFNSNGADLQTASAYALARSHLAGLEGMSEGVTVLGSLFQTDSKPWPRGVSARAEILGQLFGQWQAVLREMDINICDLADLGRLNLKLEQLHLTLLDHTPVPTLEALRQQIAQRAARTKRDAPAVAAHNPERLSSSHPQTQRHPAVTQPTPTHVSPPAKKRRTLWGWLLAVALFCLIGALAWR